MDGRVHAESAGAAPCRMNSVSSLRSHGPRMAQSSDALGACNAILPNVERATRHAHRARSTERLGHDGRTSNCGGMQSACRATVARADSSRGGSRTCTGKKWGERDREVRNSAHAPKKKKKKKASPLPHRQSSACSSPPPRYSAMLRTLKPTLLLLLTVQTSTTSGRSTVHWCRAVHQRAYGQRRRVDSEGKCICSGGKKKYCPCWDGCAHARQLHFVPTEPVLTWSFPQSCRILEFYLTWLAPFRVPGKHTRLLLCYPNADMQSDFIRGRRNRYRSDGWVGLMASL